MEHEWQRDYIDAFEHFNGVRCELILARPGYWKVSSPIHNSGAPSHESYTKKNLVSMTERLWERPAFVKK